MNDKSNYIQWFLAQNPWASYEEAEQSYNEASQDINSTLQQQIRRGYANPDGTLNTNRVENLEYVDARRPFGFYHNGQYYGPTIEEYIKDGVRVGDKGNFDIHTGKSNFNEELNFINADKEQGYLRKNPNVRVVAEYVGNPNPHNVSFNNYNGALIREGKRKPRHTGPDRHVITIDENGKIRDLNLDMIPSLSGSYLGATGLRNKDYEELNNEDDAARLSRWTTISDENGNLKPKFIKNIEKKNAAEKIKVNPDGTITHYNPMRYSIPEVEKARQMNAQPDNLFHEFANGGYLYMRKNNLSTPTLKSADGVTMGKPMRLEELQKLREDWEQNAQSSDETNAQSSDSATTPPSDKTTTQLPDNSDGLSNDDIDNLALQTLRGVYGNGKKRKEALGDAYAAVQKRVNEMLKEMQAAKEAKKAAKEAARNRKAWDETPEEYKQQLTPKKYNPRSYDLTTDDLRLHERAARQAQQERSLDDNPHSRIRDNGETKRLIGGTNNYDIYL